jgi:hypothetical protein
MRNFRLCFPPMEPQVFCMHSKLLLMFHPGYLRIAVPSANLTPTDWGEDRLMENVRDYAYRMSLSFLTVYRLYFLLTSPDLKFLKLERPRSTKN